MARTTHAAVRLLQSVRYNDGEVEDLAERTAATIALLAGVEVTIPGPTPEKPGDPFIVTHTLGQRPDRVEMVNAGDYGGICFARAEDRELWNEISAVIRCTVRRETNLTVRFTRRPQ
jgi:hypothetical protein